MVLLEKRHVWSCMYLLLLPWGWAPAAATTGDFPINTPAACVQQRFRHAAAAVSCSERAGFGGRPACMFLRVHVVCASLVLLQWEAGFDSCSWPEGTL